jgi:hypothetical protein
MYVIALINILFCFSIRNATSTKFIQFVNCGFKNWSMSATNSQFAIDDWSYSPWPTAAYLDGQA